MAKKVEVEIDIKSNVGESIADLKELKKQLKQTAAGSDEFKKLYGQIDDLEDKIKGAKGASSDWIDTLENAGGPLGAIGGALNKAKVATSSFGAALKATGIGLIVALVGGLVAAFSQTEGSLKKLEPLLIGMEKIFGGIVEVMQPLLDIFLEMALKALPYITSGIGKVYSGFVAFFTLIKEAGIGVGKIIKGIFTLDTDSITAGYDQLKGSWGKTVEAYDAGVQRFEEGTKKITKTQKENLKTQKDDADKALQDKLKRMEAEDKIDEAKLNKMKAEALLLATTEQQKLDIEKAFAEKSYELKKKDLEDKQALYKKGSDEYKTLQAELINLDAEKLNRDKEFADKQNEIIEDAAQKAKEKAKEKEEQDKKDADAAKEKRQKDLEEKLLGFEIQLAFDAQTYEQRKAIITEREQADLTAEGLTENQKTAIRKQAAADRKAVDMMELEAKHEIQSAQLELVSQFGNFLSEIAGKNKALAIAGIVVSQAAAIGQIIANTGIANAKALAASPLTFGQPWVAINSISAGLSIATTIASAAKQIAQIKATPGASAGGSGGGGGGAAPTLPTVSSASAPQVQTGGGMNPTQQIGETLSRSQKPIQAYVVSQQVSSQQALDRRTNVAATFG
jgi:hypothetical protein